MPFVTEILKYRSLSIVGLEKNTGKTETLNYVLRNIPEGYSIAVTSIGTDGERRDQVTKSSKPEIVLREGVYFSTAEKYYAGRKLTSEILDVGSENTAAGRIITAKTLSEGKVILSGYPSTSGMRRWITSLERHEIGLVIVDGALSRLSSASPAVSESMILSTGAAFSSDMNTLVRETTHIAELIKLPLADEEIRSTLEELEQGVWAIDKKGKLLQLDISSSLLLDGISTDFMSDCSALYISGALTERFVNTIAGDGRISEVELVVRDFTKIFISSRVYGAFTRSGGRISVLNKSNLIAVTVNPTAPNGLVLDSDILCERLSQALSLPVYDILKNGRDTKDVQ